ncbi:MAG: UDP-N-acetylmuramate--L-alanine ligase [Actinobacteria bacterium]|nr:UDP-N-acetylmuramate--L-alanine ligase [Actinomycetota bacterium]MBM3712661.1 UDP-N-acetylmuramate--L-alanine ligase [Actinomycetota bacterium]
MINRMKKNSNQKNPLEKFKSFFLIGIGGAGMSAIAVVLNGMGFTVSGSDLKQSRYTDLLKEEGIKVYIGHDKKNVDAGDAVIYSTAIPRNNVELAAANVKGIPVFTRGEVLSWILNSRKGIAVTGTHGKTTTTSMISLIFRGLELEPTIIIGGELNELGSNARYGNGEYIIAEACESDGTFLKYKPFVGVITNIEEDHMDYWQSFNELKNSFYRFIGNVKNRGFVVINGDEIDACLVKKVTNNRIITFGIGSNNEIYAKNIKLSNYSSTYDLAINPKINGFQGKKEFNISLIIPGIFNIKNSLASLAVCYGLGLDLNKAVEILQFFTGVKRRFEKRGEKKGALIFDDYAHHPTEVEATLNAAATDKKGRIITVFQPHRYTRLANLYNRFSKSFDNTDILIVTDVFASDEQPILGVNGKLLIDSLIEEGFDKKIIYIPKIVDVKDYLIENIKKDDVVLIMGAGDVTRVTEDLLKYA